MRARRAGVAAAVIALGFTLPAATAGASPNESELTTCTGGVLAAKLYNWVNFNPEGGVVTVCAADPCTRTWGDMDEGMVDYPVGMGSRSEPLNLDLPGDHSFVNRVSSIETFNHCDVRLYDNGDGPAQTGLSSTWIDEAHNLREIGSGWYNRADSIAIS